MNIELKGPVAAVVVVAILVIAGGRVVTRGETTNPRLEQEIRQELLTRQGALAGKTLDGLAGELPDQATLDRLIELSDAEGIRVHSMKLSAPLSGSDQRIVRVEFTLPGEARRTEYWVMDRPAAGVWHFRYETSRLRYHLNFF